MAIIGTLPNNIQNGQVVDATPLMADFNFIVNQVNSNANPNGTFTAPSGTRMVFHQAAAPSGWTQDTSITDHTIQVTTTGGTTGGANNYSGMFLNQWTSDGHALTIGELASHSHGITDPGHNHAVGDPGHAHNLTNGNGNVGAGNNPRGSDNSAPYTGGPTSTAATGISIGIHATGVTVNNAGSGTAHTHTKTFNANYVAMIMAAKT